MFVYNSWGEKLPGWKVPNPDEDVITVPTWLLKAIERGTIKMHKNENNKVFEATIVQENGYQRVRPTQWIVECYEDDYLRLDDSQVLEGFKRFG